MKDLLPLGTFSWTILKSPHTLLELWFPRALTLDLPVASQPSRHEIKSVLSFSFFLSKEGAWPCYPDVCESEFPGTLEKQLLSESCHLFSKKKNHP